MTETRLHKRRLLAIDPSLVCSGWALMPLNEDALLGAGKIRSLAASFPLATRLADLQKRIDALFTTLALGVDDIVVCEAPTTMRDPHAALKVEQVRSIFEIVARARGACVPGRVNPRSIHGELLGMRGRQLERSVIKNAAVETVCYLYGSSLLALGLSAHSPDLKKHQDIVDAILIAHLSKVRVLAALVGGITLEAMFDVKKYQNRNPRIRA